MVWEAGAFFVGVERRGSLRTAHQNVPTLDCLNASHTPHVPISSFLVVVVGRAARAVQRFRASLYVCVCDCMCVYVSEENGVCCTHLGGRDNGRHIFRCMWWLLFLNHFCGLPLSFFVTFGPQNVVVGG